MRMMICASIALIILPSPVQEVAAFVPFFTVPLRSDATIGFPGLRSHFSSSPKKKNYSSSRSSSSLNYYGPPRNTNNGSDEDNRNILASSSSSSSSKVVSPFSLSNHLNGNNNNDPLCDFEDVDCQAFLPQTVTNHLSDLPSDTYLATQLKTRSESIQQERIEYNWKVAHCPTSFVVVSNSDYIRRVHMETYPIAVCGGARGGVYVVNLESKNVIGKVEGVHIGQVEDEQTPGSSSSNGTRIHATMAKEAMEKLYGTLDGGGVVSVAIHQDVIASSGREGGVRLWKMNHSLRDETSNLEETSIANTNLVPLGSIPELDHTIVTCVKFDSNDMLWAACFDGTVRAYNIVEHNGRTDDGVFPSRMSLFQSDFTDSVLDMHLCEELQLGVCATADGGAALFHMNDGQFFAGIILSEVSARSILIMKHRNRMEYCVLCGTSDGIIHSLPLNINAETGAIDEENPFRLEDTDTAIKPRHVGPVICMTSPGDGRFVSGGQDGALRIWDCSDERYSGTDDAISSKESIETVLQTKCMYALTGYKVWLGSACTDGKRLVSDGGENSVVVRDFQ